MNRKWMPIILVLSAFFLFACGLTDRFFNNTEQSNPIEVEDASPVEPLETSSLEETESPQETALPTETQPTEEIEASASKAQPETQSACYHPFFPIIDGATWTFQSSLDSGYTLRVDETGEDTFTLTQIMDDEDTEFTVDWYCSDEGLLRGTFAQADLLKQTTSEEGTPELVFETLEWEGETLPAPDQMQLGHAWTSNYTLSAELNLEGFSQTMEVKVSVDHEISAVEEVTVPAGTFPQAYRVDSTGTIEMIMGFGELTTPFSGFEFNYSTWYVEGVGMVKSGSEFSGFSDSVELTQSSLLE